MTDRHRIKTMTLRLPEGLSSWLREEAARQGKPLRALMLEILEAARHEAS